MISTKTTRTGARMNVRLIGSRTKVAAACGAKPCRVHARQNPTHRARFEGIKSFSTPDLSDSVSSRHLTLTQASRRVLVLLGSSPGHKNPPIAAVADGERHPPVFPFFFPRRDGKHKTQLRSTRTPSLPVSGPRTGVLPVTRTSVSTTPARSSRSRTPTPCRE